MKRQLIAVAIVAAFAAAWQSAPFRAVVWGATWGNNVAGLEWAAGGGVIAWLGREHIGANLAAWWDRHHGPHTVKRHRQALEEHEAAKEDGGGQ